MSEELRSTPRNTLPVEQEQPSIPRDEAEHTSSEDQKDNGHRLRDNEEGMHNNRPPLYTILPWQIGLFLLTSTIVQNFSYDMTSITVSYAWPAEQISTFYSLVYNMIYLGPLFGLVVDLVRVEGERYRPVIVVSCLINAALCFAAAFAKSIYEDKSYHACLIVSWLMEVAVMFIYIPMNAVVIWHGNRVTESRQETSARIGGLMAQAMCWRTAGSFLQSIFSNYSKATVPIRTHVIIAGAGSLLLIAQVFLLMKRSYFLDHREASLADSTPVRFYKSLVRLSDNAVSRDKQSSGSSFIFVLCFVLYYFLLPDALYNTLYSFNAMFTSSFSTNLYGTVSVLGSLGALVGAALYAIWMHVEYSKERGLASGSVQRTSPAVIVFAGCAAWAFGTFFHLFGEMGSGNASFNWKVFIPIQSFVVQLCLRFAFMPTMSLAAMHAPRNYETAAFELFSVCTTGGGVISSAITTSFMSSMVVTVSNGYWKALLLMIFFQFLPMLAAFSLPKHRDAPQDDDDTMEYITSTSDDHSHQPDMYHQA